MSMMAPIRGGIRGAIRGGIRGGGGGASYLIAAGSISPAFTLTRAQTGGALSTALASDGTTLQTYAADVPRFNSTARRLLLEGQRTNLFLNSATLSTQNVTVAATPYAVSFRGTGTITFSGAYVGSLVGTGATVRSSLVFTPTAGTLTCTVTGSVTSAHLEAGALAITSYIPTTSAAQTRGGDVCTAPVSAFGIAAGGALTITGVCMMPQNAASPEDQTILVLDAGSDTNQYYLTNSVGAAQINFGRRTAGVFSNTLCGSFTAGTAFRYALITDGLGGASALLEGGSWQSVTGGPTTHTTLRVGTNTAGNSQTFGEHTNFQITAGALSQSAAAARMAATPLV